MTPSDRRRAPRRRWAELWRARRSRLAVATAVALAIAVGSELAVTRPSSPAAVAGAEYSNLATETVGSTWSWPTGEGNSDPLALRERAYTLELVRTTGMLTVQAPTGTFSLPLTALVGRAALPAGSYFVATTNGSELSLYTFDHQGVLLEQARLLAHPTFFTVDFSARLGGDPFAGATFFDSGHLGLPTRFLHQAFSPDPVSPSLSPTPTTYLGVHPPLPTAPFAPPPFDLEFRTGRGWTGFGLVQVPNATALSLTSAGGLSVNYPLSVLARIRDQGAGGRVTPPAGVPGQPGGGLWLGFPAFVVTLGGTAPQGLAAYHDALSQLGEAPVAAPPGQRPGWWSQPMVDTWGQQLVSGAGRNSPAFTANWVRNFVTSWRQQFGVAHFTLVIDAQWQAKLGHTTPSPRFGGVPGMRLLIQQLHAQGVRVLLWWPLWKDQAGPRQHLRVDPTSPGFPAQTARQMAVLLGTGPGDLGADGLKLDWGFLVPPPSQERLVRPQLGIGAALLLRYMTVLSKAAWKADPGAVVDGSAVAPQFGGTEDTLRLYDAHTASTWSYRAAIVSAVDPLSQIDGDGWALTGPQAVAHIVESAVFGVPAVYYSTHWSGGQPISRTLARALGALLAIGQQRGQGQADLLPGGGWSYVVGRQVTARTLANAHALVIYHYYRGRCLDATVISAVPTEVSVPNCADSTLTSIRSSHGRGPRLDRDRTSSSFTVAAGVTYELAFSATHHHRPVAVVGQPVLSSPESSPMYSAGGQLPAWTPRPQPTP
ncbi:MAG: hypothetical protein ACYCZN_15170 [Candidatus Dormibacteria bacterium]